MQHLFPSSAQQVLILLEVQSSLDPGHLSFSFPFCIPRALGKVPKWSPPLRMHRVSCGQWAGAEAQRCEVGVSPGSGGQGRLFSQWVIRRSSTSFWGDCCTLTKLLEPPWAGWKYQFNHQSLPRRAWEAGMPMRHGSTNAGATSLKGNGQCSAKF